MKTKLPSAIIAVTLLIAPIVGITCCTNQQLTDSAITTGVTVATTTGLKMAINDAGRRTVIADYLDVYSHALRSVVGKPTPDELTVIVNQFVPENIKAQYPELVTFAIPLIVSAYKQAYDKWGSDKAVKYLNDIAAGIESGAACCTTKK